MDLIYTDFPNNRSISATVVIPCSSNGSAAALSVDLGAGSSWFLSRDEPAIDSEDLFALSRRGLRRLFFNRLPGSTASGGVAQSG